MVPRRWTVVSALAVLIAVWSFVQAPIRLGNHSTSSLRWADGTWYRVYFTQPQSPPKTQGVDGLDTALVADLDRAKRSIDIATFDFDLRSVTDALKRAHRRGVAVRMIVDGQHLDKPLTALLLGELQQAGVSITFDRRDAFMHNKIVLIDERTVWTGSWNLTVNDTWRNNNSFLRLTSPALAQNYRAKFDALFAGNGGPGRPVVVPEPDLMVGTVSVHTFFSPDAPIADELLRRIAAAQHAIHVLAFTFTSDPIAQALLAAEQRGVKVHVVLERRNAQSGASVYTTIEDKLDVLEDGNCYNMHHKVMVIDERTVMVGSYNYTKAAQEQNDENVLIIEDATLAQHYLEEWERVVGEARRPMRCR